MSGEKLHWGKNPLVQLINSSLVARHADETVLKLR